MGAGMSSLYESKAYLERKLADQKRQLRRVLSKSNSMESLDKAEIKDIKYNIGQTEVTLNVINKAIEDENAPSF